MYVYPFSSHDIRNVSWISVGFKWNNTKTVAVSTLNFAYQNQIIEYHKWGQQMSFEGMFNAIYTWNLTNMLWQLIP